MFDPTQIPGAIVDPADIIKMPNLRPLLLMRQRLESIGLWEAMCGYLFQNPDKLLKLLSTDRPGMVDADDPDTVAALIAIGADPATILAP